VSLAAAIDWQPAWLAPFGADAPALQALLGRGLSVADALNGLNERHERHALNTLNASVQPMLAQATSHPQAELEAHLQANPKMQVQAQAQAQAQAVRFVPQSALPLGQAYEQFIFDSGQVPTRENLHDLFNGLCWRQFPRTKRRLNVLQAEQIAAVGVQPLRGAVRDALTVFDENAAFLTAPQPIWEALEARQWSRLFVDLRPLWREARLVLFGHALLEKLTSPRKAITAHVYQCQRGQPVAGSLTSLSSLDVWMADDLNAGWLAQKPFVPLPVLGVPGWWAGNEDFSFYDDAEVFRPQRSQSLPP
jgi:hypothetical protein